MRLSLSLLLCALPIMAVAQSTGNIYREDSSIKLFQAGVQRPLAWAGGFNAPQFAQADLNNDGLKDLVVYEWGEAMVRTFLNKGTATAAQYVYAPEFALNFPHCQDYLKLEDYNRDGISDLIHKGNGGFDVWKGYYNWKGQLSFTFFKQLRYDSPFVGNVNAYTQASDIPGVVDIDGDGDLDFFGYDVNGGFITFYKNCQVELGLPKDSIHICIPSNCWGHMYQAFARPYVLGLTPNSSGIGCSSFGTFSCKMVGGQQYWKEARHQGNCMLMLDYDGDGDIDLLDGNISFPDLQFLRNGRAQYGGTDSTIGQDTMWQSGGHQVYMPQWPAAFYVDADGDGKRDILVSPHDYSAGENYKTIAFYKNTGTVAAPLFTYQNDTFLVDKTIDLGTGSYPVLYDYNKDGRPDLFVGSDGYYTTSNGTLRSRISYYQNSSVGGVTRFTWVTSDFMGLSAQGYQGAALAFGDLDADGDDDMVIGHTDGTLSYFKNTATAANVQPVWTLSQPLLKGATGDTLDVGYFASPFIYDINKDGKPDLLVGNQTGSISFYQNSPTVSGPNLTLNTSTLGDVESVPGRPDAGYSSLYIGKMDSTGTEYLVTGGGLGILQRYSGFQTGNVTTPYTLVDSFYNKIDVGLRSTLTVADIDGDGKYDMITGNRLGGLNLFRQGPPLDVQGPTTGLNSGCMMYPNPAHTGVVVTWDAAFADGSASLSVSLLNAIGQTVRQSDGPASRRAVQISVEDLPGGIYTCRIETAGAQQSLKLNVIR